uniref:Sugar transporter ERD6-like 14 n=1 Tax=Bactrocera dorsalis TaxID=27457 RepID=A0A034WVY1_BACDO
MPPPPSIEEPGKQSWLRMLYRYRLQFQAMASASTIYFAGGLKLAWCIFEKPVSGSEKLIDTHLLTIAWFVGVAAGAIIAGAFVHRVSKNISHWTSGTLLLLGGLLFACAPTSFACILSSCLLEGSAYGINQVQGLVTAGEVAHKHIRGLLVSSERVFLWLGICLQLFCTRLWFLYEPTKSYPLHLNQLHGTVVILMALCALACNTLYRFESPLLLHMQERNLAATYVMNRLQSTSYTSAELTQKHEECKQMLEHDAGRQTTRKAVRKSNSLPLLKVLLLRCYGTVSLSLPVSRTFVTASMTGLNCAINCVYLLSLCGVLASILGALCVDICGRRRITVICLLFSGTCAFLLAGVLRYIYEQISLVLLTHLTFELVVYLMWCYQAFICAGVSLISSVYMSEAFTVSAKACCLALVVVCEQFVQIALALLVFYTDFNEPHFFFIVGVLGMLLGILALFTLPETMKTSLYECLLKFNNVP